MNYPLISEYVEAIKAAEDNFDQLKHLRPVLGEDGEPVMTSGNFAVVFKVKDEQTGKLHAVKCFLKEQEGRAEAYRQIAEELEFVSSTFLTPIKYLDKELFVDSANSEDSEFPVLLMDWVEGQTLDKYIREHIDDQYELSLLAYQFSRLAMWLMPQPFAHGDLKPDNILVKEDGTLVLVDYDGMYVPAMKGQKARELGSPDFRHPGRTEEVFDDHIDDFSLASILLSLKAIALQPSLLEEYGASDRLLFSEKDYRNLSESSALGALQPLMQDAELASLYSLYILALSQNNLSQVSFRLFNLSRPDKSQYEEKNLSTVVTEEDLENAWTDEFGVKYSADRKRLLEATTNIRHYSIKDGTRVICKKAFLSCCIGTIYIPDSVIIIGDRAFDECRLNNINIPDSVTAIGDKAFLDCCNLTCIHIPNSVTTIGYGAFKGCCDLTGITVGKNNKVYYSDGSNAIIEKSSHTLLFGCKNTIIPDEVINIEKSAFYGCSGLTSIHIPDGVITIGECAFYGCSGLTSIHIPDGVTTIGESAFKSCSGLTSITVGKNNKGYYSDGSNAIIEKSSNILLRGCKNTVIPDGVVSIGDWAFDNCCLYSIHIPNSVTTIGDSAFYGCSALTSIHIPNSVTAIGDSAFYGCSDLSNIKIPDRITTIGNRAFTNCSSLFNIHIPNSVTTIGYDAFYGCSGLSSIYIPDGVTTIGESAFRGCYGLFSIHIPDSLTTIADSTFRGCCGLTSIHIPDKVTNIDGWAFVGCHCLTSIHIPDKVTNIGKSAFYDCNRLSCIYIPDSVATIGDCAFGYCSNLTRIIIPIGTIDKFEYLLPNYKDKLVEQDKVNFSTEVTDEEEICLAYCSEESQAFKDKMHAIWQPHTKIIKIKKNGKLGVVIDDGTSKKQIIPFIYDTCFDEDGNEAIISEDFFDNSQDFGYFGIKHSDGTFTIHRLDKDGSIIKSFTCEKFYPDSYRLKGKYYLRHHTDGIGYDVISREYMYCATCIDDSFLAFRTGNKWSLKSYDLKTIYIDNLECSGFGKMYWTPNGCYFEIWKGGKSQICLWRKETGALILPNLYDSISLRFLTTPKDDILAACFVLQEGEKFAVCSNDLQNTSPFIFCRVGSMTNVNEVKVTRLINDNEYEFVYKIINRNGWRYKGARPFSPEEIAAVARVEVVPSQYGNTVCFFMNNGGQTYIPLLSYSSLTVGDTIDLRNAKLITLSREGDDDIYRVME